MGSRKRRRCAKKIPDGPTAATRRSDKDSAPEPASGCPQAQNRGLQARFSDPWERSESADALWTAAGAPRRPAA